MGFKFAGISPGNSAENYSAVATDGHNDGRHDWNGPSYAPSHQVRISVIFEIRAHTTDTTMGRRMWDGPSSWNRRAINEINPTRPGWTLLNIWPFILPTPPYSTPLLPTSSHLPSLFHFHTSPTDHYSHNLPKPYHYYLLVGAAAIGIYLATWIILHLCFLHFLGMCL